MFVFETSVAESFQSEERFANHPISKDIFFYGTFFYLYGLKEFLIHPSPYLAKISADRLLYVPLAKDELPARAS